MDNKDIWKDADEFMTHFNDEVRQARRKDIAVGVALFLIFTIIGGTISFVLSDGFRHDDESGYVEQIYHGQKSDRIW
jgi:hypothetical protein